MRFTTARRWLAGFGVAGALVATAAAPATAGAPAGELDIYFADTTIAADSAGKIESPVLRSTSGPLTLHELTIRYDFTDLAGKVTVAEEEEEFGDCTPSGASMLTCTLPYPIDVDEQGLAGVAWVVLAPTEEAADGDEGDLKVSVSAAGVDAVTHTAKVRVGEGVDLAAGERLSRSGAPGSKVSTPLTVANNGEATIQGAVAVFYNDYAFRSTTKFDNCTYADEDLLTCKFDEALAPGSSYSATLPYTIGADTQAPGGAYGEIVWMTTAEFEDYVAYLADRGVTDLGKPGTDGELNLTRAGGDVQARGRQADTNPENNWSSVELKVTGKNGVDLSAIGATLTGEAGDLVIAKLGLRNEGPATVDATRGGGSFTNVRVTIPTGTTALGVPENCSPWKSDDEWGEPGEPGAPAYHCYSESFIKVGDVHSFEFKLRIDSVVPNATGSIAINADCACEGMQSDLDGSNDEAKILVNATEEGGGGGGLPITGAPTGIVAGAGVLLLGAGVFGFVLARRRRTRFVA